MNYPLLFQLLHNSIQILTIERMDHKKIQKSHLLFANLCYFDSHAKISQAYFLGATLQKRTLHSACFQLAGYFGDARELISGFSDITQFVCANFPSHSITFTCFRCQKWITTMTQCTATTNRTRTFTKLPLNTRTDSTEMIRTLRYISILRVPINRNCLVVGSPRVVEGAECAGRRHIRGYWFF